MEEEDSIYLKYLSSPQNKFSKKEAVDSLRHLLMNLVKFDTSDKDSYLKIYESTMSYISGRYPILAWEVERQVNKKKRRIRRHFEKQQVE